MNRSLSPKHADKKMYVAFAKKASQDSFFYLFPTGFICVPAGGGLLAGAIVSGLWFLYALAAVFIVVYGWLIKFTIVSKSNEYSWDRTLYSKANDAYQSILDPESRRMARPLLEGVWEHEKITEGSHRTYCGNCVERVELINDLRRKQPTTGNDRSDIENVKMILDIRKELGV